MGLTVVASGLTFGGTMSRDSKQDVINSITKVLHSMADAADKKAKGDRPSEETLERCANALEAVVRALAVATELREDAQF
jgi:hypothetical protein